jgi:hypothetical protein
LFQSDAGDALIIALYARTAVFSAAGLGFLPRLVSALMSAATCAAGAPALVSDSPSAVVDPPASTAPTAR